LVLFTSRASSSCSEAFNPPPQEIEETFLPLFRLAIEREEIMEQLSHEKLDVYQCSIEFLGVAESMLQRLPQGYATLADQLHRASLSISEHPTEHRRGLRQAIS
jgi:hypothetical protein